MRVKGWVKEVYTTDVFYQECEKPMYVEAIPETAIRVEVEVEKDGWSEEVGGYVKIFCLPTHLIGKKVTCIIIPED
jgi:hypothetical protein